MKKNLAQVVLVTGVGKGIGYCVLQKLVMNGAYVYGVLRSKNDLKKFDKKNKNYKIFLGDVRNINLIKKIFRVSIKEKKIINGLVNNAGIRQRSKFEKINFKDLRKIFDINFFSIFKIMQLYFKYLKKYKISSSIVNVSSIVANHGFRDLSGYASTKGALQSLTKCFAVEKASYKIRANLVNPGFIKTSFYKKFQKKTSLYKWTLSRTPLGRWGNPDEVAELICFLISDQSSYINGEVINIDGGWTNA